MWRILIWLLICVTLVIFWSLAPEALAQPANDNCASPTVISGTGPFPVTITQDTATATTESSDPNLTCGSTLNPKQSHSVWFRFTPSSAGTISIDTIGSTYDTVLAVFTGVCGSLTAAACNDDSVGLQSSLSNVVVTAGVPILIEVTSFSSTAGGTLVLNFTFTGQSLFQGPAQGRLNLQTVFQRHRSMV